MSDPKYLKCPCRHCGASIEFPAQGIGLAVNCPHCNAKTTLFAPPVAPVAALEPAEPDSPPAESNPDAESPATESVAPPEAEPRSARRWPVYVLLTLVVLGAAASAFMVRKRHKGAADTAEPLPSNGRSHDLTAASNTPAARSPSESNSVPVVSRPPKSIDDFKIGAITLTKAKGSSLVYAVGTLRNQSDEQRFGIRLELELADARGQRIGVAKDYRNVLEPRQEWAFRALVLESKAVSAKVASIREDE